MMIFPGSLPLRQSLAQKRTLPRRPPLLTLSISQKPRRRGKSKKKSAPIGLMMLSKFDAKDEKVLPTVIQALFEKEQRVCKCIDGSPRTTGILRPIHFPRPDTGLTKTTPLDSRDDYDEEQAQKKIGSKKITSSE